MKAMCLSVYGVKLWNNLPENIKALRSIHSANNRYKNIYYHCISILYIIILYNGIVRSMFCVIYHL